MEDGVSLQFKNFDRPDTVIGGTDGIDFPLHKIYNVADEIRRLMFSPDGVVVWLGVYVPFSTNPTGISNEKDARVRLILALMFTANNVLDMIVEPIPTLVLIVVDQ